MFGRRDRYVTNWDDRDQADFLRGIGADLVRGHARLQGSRRVAVTTSDGRVVMLAGPIAVSSVSHWGIATLMAFEVSDSGVGAGVMAVFVQS